MVQQNTDQPRSFPGWQVGRWLTAAPQVGAYFGLWYRLGNGLLVTTGMVYRVPKTKRERQSRSRRATVFGDWI
jgi:hypothetical protein